MRTNDQPWSHRSIDRGQVRHQPSMLYRLSGQIVLTRNKYNMSTREIKTIPKYTVAVGTRLWHSKSSGCWYAALPTTVIVEVPPSRHESMGSRYPTRILTICSKYLGRVEIILMIAYSNHQRSLRHEWLDHLQPCFPDVCGSVSWHVHSRAMMSLTLLKQ